MARLNSEKLIIGGFIGFFVSEIGLAEPKKKFKKAISYDLFDIPYSSFLEQFLLFKLERDPKPTF